MATPRNLATYGLMWRIVADHACQHCRRWQSEHGPRGKCIFQPTSFTPVRQALKTEGLYTPDEIAPYCPHRLPGGTESSRWMTTCSICGAKTLQGASDGM